MRKIFLTLSFFLFSLLAFGQPPQAFSYQAVAYDGTAPVTDEDIGVKISILDVSDTGTLLYSETFIVHTDLQGIFSLNIGTGTPVIGGFSAINWGLNSKFIKVEIDIAGGTSYVFVGSNQLMSVPYALYTEKTNANSTMTTLTNINELKYFNKFKPDTDNIAVYVQGYSSPSDGGGGIFIFKRYSDMDQPFTSQSPPKTPPPHPDDDLGVYINSYDGNLQSQGIWVRQFNGEVDVRYYGAVGYSEDCTERIQNAIDYAAKSVGDFTDRPFGHNITNVVFIPNGGYRVRKLILRAGVTLKGSSKEHTSISYLSPVMDGYIDDDEPLIVIDSGYVKDVHVSDISFVGNDEAQGFKPCFYINGVQVNNGGAGLWDSSFKNINIFRFKGDSMHFQGGGGSSFDDFEYKKVNQFIVFEGVYVESVGDKVNPNTHHALSISGFNGQFSFTNCRFDGGPHIYGTSNGIATTYFTSGRNVYIGRIKDDDIAAPTNINFNTCTFQHGAIGIYIMSADNINIYGSWFENFERAITAVGGLKESKSINIMNNVFGRAAGQYGTLEDGSGAVITYNRAQINVLNNVYGNHGIGKENTHFIRLETLPTDPEDPEVDQNLGANTFGNSFIKGGDGDSEIRYSYGIKKTIDVSVFPTGDNNINTQNAKLIYLYNIKEVKTINEITSLVSASELICIRSDGGYIKFTETKNIYLGNMVDPIGGNSRELTLNHGGFALFVKSDDGENRETYNLICYKNRE